MQIAFRSLGFHWFVAAAVAGMLLSVQPAVAQPAQEWRRGPADQHLVPRNPTTSPNRVIRCNPPVVDVRGPPRGKVCGAWKTEQMLTQRGGIGLSAQCFITVRTCTAVLERRVAR